jgi:hypothetical protein
MRNLLRIVGWAAWIAACSTSNATSENATAGTAGTSSTSGGGSSDSGSAGAGGGAGSAGAGGAGAGEAGDAGAGGAPDAGESDDGTANAGDGSCGGPVPTTVVDAHCATPDGGRGYDVPAHDGTEADDDNCMFHVTMSVPCIALNQPATFTFVLTNLAGMTPATGAAPLLDGTVGSHPFPNTNPTATENDGVYTIGPVIFDRTGRWTITLHVYDTVADAAKHSHVSFNLDVF